MNTPTPPALGALAFVALTSVASAQEPSLNTMRYELDNGLDVVLVEDHSTPIVHTQVWYHVGSKNEQDGLTGFAHLFEHLMFRGSLNNPGEYFEPIQGVGGTLNGTTNTDRTNYFETVPAHELPLALFLEADRMGHLLEVLDISKLDNQREVVRNERRQRYENPPYGEAWKDLMAALHPVGHPYHHPTIGSHEDLQNADLDDVKAFFRKWYVPNNATLVVIGDLDVDTTKRLVEEQFGGIPRGEDPKQLPSMPVTLTETQRIEQVEDVPEARFWAGWHSAEFFDKGDAELDLLSRVLCGGVDSRLEQKVVRELGLARSLSCYQVSRDLGSVYVISGTAADGHTTDEVLKAATDEIQNVLTNALPTVEELEAARAQYQVGYWQTLATITGRAGLISTYLFHLDKADYLTEDLARYEATPEQVVEAAKVVFDAPHVELHIHPPVDGEESK